MKKLYSNYSLRTIIKAGALGKMPRLLITALCILVVQFAHAQAVKITGLVKGSDRLALPGATVKVKGTTNAVSTGSLGEFTISVPSRASVLVFSFVGTVPVEIAVGTQTRIAVTLKDEANGLNEVVVIGYGTARRPDLTGSYSPVNMGDLEKAPVKSFDDALAGRVAGVVVNGNDGQPGSNNNIVIRGYGSITNDVSPLYVIDGFPSEALDFNSIAPADIESIEILKDASAAAIYGTRGSNGVIVVTTKRGKVGAPVVTYNGYYGTQAPVKQIKLLDSYEFVKFQLEYRPLTAPSMYLTPLNGPQRTLEDYRSASSTRLSDYFYDKNPGQINHDVSLRGGNDATQYSLSFNKFDQKGIIIYTGFNRLQGRVSLDQRVNQKLKVGVNANYSKGATYGNPVSQTGAGSSALSALYGIWAWRPTQGATFPGATPTGDNPLEDEFDLSTGGTPVSASLFNPLINAQNTYRWNYVNTLNVNAYLQYTISKTLTFKSTAGVNSSDTRLDVFNNSHTQLGSPVTGSSRGVNGSVSNGYNDTWLNENTLTFNKVFAKYHTINIVGGVSATKTTTKGYGVYSQFLANDFERLDGLDEATSGNSTALSSGTAVATLASAFTRVNYNYKSKYILTGTLRADGSSKFPVDNHWGYFPVAAFAWRISSENFMKKFTFIDDAKIRVSYGTIGNNRVPVDSFLPQFSFDPTYGYNFNGATAPGGVLRNIQNERLKWESTTEKNIGIDLSLFKNRIALTVDAYEKKTDDLLLDATIPATTGLVSAQKNVGAIRNRGLEFSLNTVNIRTKNFTWTSNFNISFNVNRVLSLSDGVINLKRAVNFDSNYPASIPDYIAQIGQPISSFIGYKFDGLCQFSDFDLLPGGGYLLKPNLPDNGIARASIRPGDIRYKDISGDGTINTADLTIIGNALPIHTGGFSHNFGYKGFDLNVLFQWSYGNDEFNASKMVFVGNGRHVEGINQWAEYADRWTPENQTSLIPRAGGEGPFAYSDRTLEDGSYLKLRTVSLGYNLPAKLLNKFGVKTLRIYSSAQNLVTWTNYSGQDPETSVRNSNLTQGFDYAAYPHARTITFGLTTSF